MTCPHCQNSDPSLLDVWLAFKGITLVICQVCSKRFTVVTPPAQL